MNINKVDKYQIDVIETTHGLYLNADDLIRFILLYYNTYPSMVLTSLVHNLQKAKGDFKNENSG